jgi:hypothetical protein
VRNIGGGIESGREGERVCEREGGGEKRRDIVSASGSGESGVEWER